MLWFFFSFSATYYCFDKYFTLKETNPNDGNIELTTNFQYYMDLYQTWLVLGARRQTKCYHIKTTVADDFYFLVLFSTLVLM